MLLAALQFSDPLMLAGLVAAGIPIALHLLNRVRSPVVLFPTLRFLRLTAQKTARRRRVQQYVLLLIRCLVFALIAMAIARPLIRGGSPSAAYGFVGLLIIGIALMAAAAIAAAAIKPRESPGPATEIPTAAAPASAAPKASARTPAMRWATVAVLILAGILALTGGAFGLGTDHFFGSASGVFRGTSTACVIILDNSHSMLAKQDSLSRAAHARDHARELLAQTIRPAEAAILLTNPGNRPQPSRLSADLTALLAPLAGAEPVGRALPMRELVRDAAALLEKSDQPNHILIIDSDMARAAFSDAEVFATLKQAQHPIQVVLMSEGGSSPVDVGIANISIAQGVPVVGNDVGLDVQVINNDVAAGFANVRLLMDGVALPGALQQSPLDAAGDKTSGRKTVRLNWRPAQAGQHRLTVELDGANDAANWNNKREMIVDVAEQIKVLVVGPEEKAGARTTAFYINVVLDPFGGATAKDALGRPAWSVAPTYQGIAALGNGAGLRNFSAVFLCDVPRISPSLADALRAYVTAGGRIIWMLGPSVDRAAYNNELAGVRELLPGPIGPPLMSPGGTTVDYVDIASPILANLFDTQEPFRQIVVTGRWPLATPAAARGRILSKLSDGGVWMTEHGIGKGEIYTFLSAPSGDWTNIDTKPLIVPVMHRMAIGDAGRVTQQTSYEPGATVSIAANAASIDVKTPRGETINARRGGDGEVHFSQTLAEGLYTWTTVDKKQTGEFIVNPPAEEVDLTPADTSAMANDAHTPGGPAALIATSPAELRLQLDKVAEGSSLIPGLLALVIMLALVESLLANRHMPGRGRTLEPANVREAPAKIECAAA